MRCCASPPRCGPRTVCLVPERRAEITTEGGLDVAGDATRLRAAFAQLKAAGIRVSLFIDPDPRQIESAAAVRRPGRSSCTPAPTRTPSGAAQSAQLARLRGCGELGGSASGSRCTPGTA